MGRRKVQGKGARDKGSRAERQVRDILRKIYPTELRNNVQRVPMSGAGYIKGDVADLNDPFTCYEVKNQEKLKMHDWWRQTKSQAGATKTPVLVVTQSFRPFYFILLEKDWEALLSQFYHEIGYTEKDFRELKHDVGCRSTFFDKMANLPEGHTGTVVLDGDKCVSISAEEYVEVKRSLYLGPN